MAQFNFPDPAVTQTYTEAGITWTWNATLGVWSSETSADGGGEYLSKTGDDTTTGQLTADGGFVGDLTGDVTGNVTGDTAGTHTGPVTGDVTGDLTGTADLANQIPRQGTTSSANANHRILLGEGNNTAGPSSAYVVTDTARLYYNPSTNQLAGLNEVNLGATKFSSIACTSNTNYTFYMNGDNRRVNFLSSGVNTSSPCWIEYTNDFIGLCTSANPSGSSASNIKFGIRSTQNAWIGIKNGAGYLGLSGSGSIQTGGNVTFYQTLSSTRSSSAMKFVSKNGTYNFRNSGDSSNSGTINGGNVRFFSLSRQIGDENDPANFNAEGDYIGPVENFVSTIETLKQEKADLLATVNDLVARVEELESNTLQPLYSTLADLPDASEHHGKTAHVHSEGALYFAHAGNWVKLQNA